MPSTTHSRSSAAHDTLMLSAAVNRKSSPANSLRVQFANNFANMSAPLLLGLALLVGPAHAAAAQRPNVLIILADDKY